MRRTDATQEQIDTLIDMKIMHNRTDKELLDYIVNEYEYSVQYAYTLRGKALAEVNKLRKEARLDALECQIDRLERQLETAIKEKNRRMELDITKELNKIMGLYKENINVTGEVVIKAVWGGKRK